MIGVGSFAPQAKFAFPRSYIRGIGIQIVSGTITPITNGWVLQNPPSPALYYVVLEDRFWDWSSNAYTLDFVVKESYWTPDGSPSYVPMPFLVTYYTDTPNKSPYLIYSPFSSPGGVTYFELPSAPPGYWLPLW